MRHGTKLQQQRYQQTVDFRNSQEGDITILLAKIIFTSVNLYFTHTIVGIRSGLIRKT